MNYTIRQMALYLELPFVHFDLLAHEKTSRVYECITRGRLQTDFVIDNSLQENAKKGNLTAIQQREKNKEQKRIEETRSKGHYDAYEMEYIHKDGHLVPVRLHGIVIQYISMFLGVKLVTSIDGDLSAFSVSKSLP